LAVIARQGRLILRLTASVEATEARLKRQEEVRSELDAAQTAAVQAEEETRRVLRETVLTLMDALDFAGIAANAHDNSVLANTIAGARRDGLRRLAAAGVGEIPATIGTPFDRRLHESVESRPTRLPHSPVCHPRLRPPRLPTRSRHPPPNNRRNG
jgi:hypothetical protein